MIIPFDTHVHTDISDGENSPEEMFEKAAGLGMEAVVLTDHLDMDLHVLRSDSPICGAGKDGAYERLTKAKENNKSGVKPLIGVELGQAHQFRELSAKWLNTHAYDYVLGSCHTVRGFEDFYWLDYTKHDAEALLKQYFSEVLELCKMSETDAIDALAHLTYPLRYMSRVKINLNRHKAAIDDIFRAMVDKDIALEVNTQCLGGRYNKLSPEAEEIARYRELGGRLIAIGSDAHSAETLGHGVAVAIAAVKNIGFTEAVYYENRQPQFITL